MLRNSWQVVLGNHEKGLHDSLKEGCLRELFVALDGASDEKVLQRREYAVCALGEILSFGDALKSRQKAKQLTIKLTLREAVETWPRLGTFPRIRAILES
jgi:hypothetical protein